MKKSILITGVAGVGKSSVSQKLNELGYKAYDLDDIPGLFSMIHRETKLPITDHDNADLEKVKNMTWICDIKLLRSIIQRETADIAYFAGGGSNVYEMMELFDKVILLRLNNEANKYRLKTRVENDFARTSETQEYILSKKDAWEEEMIKRGSIIVSADSDLTSVAKEIIKQSR